MVIRAYPQDYILQPSYPTNAVSQPAFIPLPATPSQPYQNNSNDFIIKFFLVLGGLIVLGYVAKKLLSD